MKKITFNVHILFYIVAIICFFTGHFKDFILFMSIILIHELGHIFAALIFKWRIENVTILPFGGIIMFKENIDKPLIEEFVISINGIIFQLIFCLFVNSPKITNYSNLILIFNLFPMFPLDGSKILNCIFNRFLSFKLSHMLSVIIAFIVFILIIIFSRFNLVLYIILFFIFIEIIKECRKHKFYFNKFLLERYLYNHKFKKYKAITKINQMKKQTQHIFKINNKYYTEYEIIRKMFDN